MSDQALHVPSTKLGTSSQITPPRRYPFPPRAPRTITENPSMDRAAKRGEKNKKKINASEKCDCPLIPARPPPANPNALKPARVVFPAPFPQISISTTARPYVSPGRRLGRSSGQPPQSACSQVTKFQRLVPSPSRRLRLRRAASRRFGSAAHPRIAAAAAWWWT
ncbi:hypothetical protein BKA80DRAFT_285033, partial [Phyllosticta citrichinensis]